MSLLLGLLEGFSKLFLLLILGFLKHLLLLSCLSNSLSPLLLFELVGFRLVINLFERVHDPSWHVVVEKLSLLLTLGSALLLLG